MPFSAKQQFAGQAVLVTGGLGFLGSIIVEQLLRLTEVRKVYLLVRGKRHLSAQQRVEELLCSPLFSLLHSEAASGRRNVFGRVQAVEGDLTLPGLGLSDADLTLLAGEVSIILHAGASIELDAEMQKTLKSNYMGTMELMSTASQFTQLRSFVHTSTYFVNNYLPRNSLVKEQIYPLPLSVGGISMNHSEFVAAMLAMEPEQANRQALELMESLNFTSTYAFGKHLTEQLVDSTCIRPGVSRAIVRPSLIASIAGEPYAGYINGYAGAGGYTMGYALGFFQGVKSVAYGSDTFLDLIPADTVAALIIAAAAAAAATFGSLAADKNAVIFHAASSESCPLTISEAFERMGNFWRANPPPLRLPGSRYVKIKSAHHPTLEGIAAGRRKAKLKIKLLGGLMQLAGKHKEVRALKMGFKAFSVHNSLAYAKSIVCSVDNVRALQVQMVPKERQDFPVLWEQAVPQGSQWDHYGNTFMAGVRRLLFRMDAYVDKTPHSFIFRTRADPAQLKRFLASSSSSKSLQDGSSSDTSSSKDAATTSSSTYETGSNTSGSSSRSKQQQEMDTDVKAKMSAAASKPQELQACC